MGVWSAPRVARARDVADQLAVPSTSCGGSFWRDASDDGKKPQLFAGRTQIPRRGRQKIVRTVFTDGAREEIAVLRAGAPSRRRSRTAGIQRRGLQDAPTTPPRHRLARAHPRQAHRHRAPATQTVGGRAVGRRGSASVAPPGALVHTAARRLCAPHSSTARASPTVTLAIRRSRSEFPRDPACASPLPRLPGGARGDAARPLRESRPHGPAPTRRLPLAGPARPKRRRVIDIALLRSCRASLALACASRTVLRASVFELVLLWPHLTARSPASLPSPTITVSPFVPLACCPVPNSPNTTRSTPTNCSPERTATNRFRPAHEPHTSCIKVTDR